MTGTAYLTGRHQVHRHGHARPATGPMSGAIPSAMPGLFVSPTPEQLFDGARRLIDGLEAALARLTAPGAAMAMPWMALPGMAMPGMALPGVRPGCGCGPGCGCDGCRHDGGCGCRDCGPDPCACTCCVTDADLVVRVRLGEQRVVPITVENERSRERDVTVDLSEWTTRGGSPAPVQGRVLPASFTVPPCGRQDVVVVVRVAPAPSGQQGGEQPAPGEFLDVVGRGPEGDGKTALPDVDACVVGYADLRVTGCDVRPVRLAVAVLPRDCEAYPVACGCTCCC